MQIGIFTLSTIHSVVDAKIIGSYRVRVRSPLIGAYVYWLRQGNELESCLNKTVGYKFFNCVHHVTSIHDSFKPAQKIAKVKQKGQPRMTQTSPKLSLYKEQLRSYIRCKWPMAKLRLYVFTVYTIPVASKPDDTILQTLATPWPACCSS